MAETKSLGIENFGSVVWLNDTSPEPQAAEETQQEEAVRLSGLIEEWKKTLPARPSGKVFSELRQQKK